MTVESRKFCNGYLGQRTVDKFCTFKIAMSTQDSHRFYLCTRVFCLYGACVQHCSVTQALKFSLRKS